MTTVRAIEGKPVVDAKKPIKLTILPNDISRASSKDPEDCVVARACRREMHAKEVRVHLGRVYIRSNEGNWTRYMTPKSLRTEIIAFDRGGQFEPGEFHLGAPQPAQRIGQPRKYKRTRVKRNGTRKKPHVVTNVHTGPA